MRIAALSVAITAGLCLSGCGFNVSGAANGGGAAMTADTDADATALALDDEVSGEITSSSGINYSDGSRYQRFSLSLTEGQAVSLSLEGPLSGALAVFDGDQLVARGDGPALAFRAAKAGDYLVAVSGRGAEAFGPFRLGAKAIQAYDGKPLAGEGEVVDWLMGSAKDYTLQVERPGLYTITLASSAFDPVLRVRGPNVEAENDDSGGGTDSMLRLFLEPGSYTLNAAALADDGRGDFNLAVRYAPLPGGMVTRDGTALVSGQTAVARVEGGAGRSFVLDVAQDAQVTIDARAEEFDTVLHVEGPAGTFEDDDGGSGTNSRLSNRLTAGRYTVRVEGLGGGSGMFEIEARVAGVEPPAADAVTAP
ncbi:ABC transporter substrate-binding protein [Luteimonas sp. 9C]|uniref:ABC transporter substrate-binding protein n=1 Tax=Luteimonas sp. 9C TaxID=2653148 RepID=UPI0012F0CFE5|nr:ABC transporter substrate-binding protein [Luteimonas sp. 9C]VXC13582.1 ABC transporter substrate-binding protein [Luteimonas sp. 9C]